MGSPDRSGLLRSAAATCFRMLLCARPTICGIVLCFSGLLISDGLATTPSAPQDPYQLQLLTRTLEEEVKLASKPQPYLLLDHPPRVLMVKSRGLVLRQFPILGWRASGDEPSIGIYRLRARPPVSRPKIQPGQDSTEHPIDVHDMPMDYLLVFDRDFVIEVAPPFAERPWHWFRRKWLSSWIRLKTWVGQESSGNFSPLPPRLSLVLPQEEAQALAWTVTEGMPLLIGRVELP